MFFYINLVRNWSVFSIWYSRRGQRIQIPLVFLSLTLLQALGFPEYSFSERVCLAACSVSFTVSVLDSCLVMRCEGGKTCYYFMTKSLSFIEPVPLDGDLHKYFLAHPPLRRQEG